MLELAQLELKGLKVWDYFDLEMSSESNAKNKEGALYASDSANGNDEIHKSVVSNNLSGSSASDNNFALSGAKIEHRFNEETCRNEVCFS